MPGQRPGKPARLLRDRPVRRRLSEDDRPGHVGVLPIPLLRDQVGGQRPWRLTPGRPQACSKRPADAGPVRPAQDVARRSADSGRNRIPQARDPLLAHRSGHPPDPGRDHLLAVRAGNTHGLHGHHDHFKYGSIGSEAGKGIPYRIWKVLPVMFPEYLPDGAKRPAAATPRWASSTSATRRPASCATRRSDFPSGECRASNSSGSTAPSATRGPIAARPRSRPRRRRSSSACPLTSLTCSPTSSSSSTASATASSPSTTSWPRWTLQEKLGPDRARHLHDRDPASAAGDSPAGGARPVHDRPPVRRRPDRYVHAVQDAELRLPLTRTVPRSVMPTCRRSGTSGSARGCPCTGTATTRRCSNATSAPRSAPARRPSRSTCPGCSESPTGCWTSPACLSRRTGS